MRRSRPSRHGRWPALIAATLAASVPAAGAPSAAPASFDGLWSISIQTVTGDCPPTYRQAIRIVRGTLYEAGEGDAQVLINGRIDPSGRVRVSVRRGEQNASGTGRLAASSGSGTWSSPSAGCSGRWTAQRRG